MNNSRREKNKRHFPAVAAIVTVALCILVGGVTVHVARTYFGLLDFTKESQETISEEAQTMIKNSIDQTIETVDDDVFFDCVVKGALYEGESFMIVYEVSAKESGKYLFIPMDAEVTDDINEWYKIRQSGISASEYASDHSLTIVNIGGGITNSDELGVKSESLLFQSKDEDVMDIYVRGSINLKSDQIPVEYSVIAKIQPINETVNSTISFLLEDIGDADIISFKTQQIGENNPTCNITGIRIIQTALGTYMDVYFDSEEMIHNNIQFHIKDPSGTTIDILLGSGIEVGDDESFYERLILNETLIEDEFVIECYNFETGETYEAVAMIEE